MQKTYFINTYGCQMNVHESEKIAGILEGLDMIPTDNIANADVLVYNTCCIRETAETKVYGHLGKAKKLKEINPKIRIILCGCMPQQPHILDTLKNRLKHVDIIIGTHNIPLLGQYIKMLDEGSGKIREIWDEKGTITEVEPKREEGVRAFVNIMYGCDNFCSYCIVPYVRGRERSRPFDEILVDVKKLLDGGYKEVMLLGQNVNSYSYQGQNFASLLRALNGISEGQFRIKFMTSHPKDLSEEVVRVVAEGKNIAKHIHLPVQAGSNRVLKLMNRKYTREEYLAKIDLIRSYIPNAGITSDIMTGFPTETEEDFLDTMDLAVKAKYNNIYSFIYNRRSGTVADKMEGQVSQDVKVERVERLIKLQSQIGQEVSQGHVGKDFCVLIEEKKKGTCFGKTENDMLVSFESDAIVGDFVFVTVTGFKNTRLLGVQKS